MKSHQLFGILLLADWAAGRVVHPQTHPSELSSFNLGAVLSNVTHPHDGDKLATAGSEDDWDVEFGEDKPKFTDEQRNKIWEDAICRGEKLNRAMILDENDAQQLLTWPHVQSQWDGDLKEELKKWGYSESDQRANGPLDNQCNFGDGHNLNSVFEELKIEPKSKGKGGPNQCYQFKHRDGPNVERRFGSLPPLSQQYYNADGKRYRVIDAFSKIGINAKDGMIIFIHRVSPKYAAKTLWNRDSVTDSELPKLRSSSDLAYGMWHRETTEESRNNLNYFLATAVVNEETNIILSRALGLANPEGYFGTPRWPGKEFVFYDDENDPTGENTRAAFAILGSNNGLAAGYFLVQHRRQLGGVKFVWKIRVFTSDKSEAGIPNILFYVDTGANAPPFDDPDESDDEPNGGPDGVPSKEPSREPSNEPEKGPEKELGKGPVKVPAKASIKDAAKKAKKLRRRVKTTRGLSVAMLEEYLNV